MSISLGIGLKIGGGGGEVIPDYGNLDFDLDKALCTADALINQAAPTFNYGATTVFAVGEYNSADTLTRALLKFDLSSIPSDVIIDSAILSINRASDLSSNARTLRVYRIKKSWTEGTGNATAPADGVTWNTYDGTNNWTAAGTFDTADCEQTEIGSLALTATEGVGYKNIILNVTSLAELDLGYGFLLKMDTETDDAYTYSYRLHATLYPYLTVKWHTLINGTVSPLFTKHISNPLLTPRIFGSVVYNGINNYLFFSTYAGNVKKATSSDGITWADQGTVMTPAAGTIDVCSVWKEGTTLYMLYRSDEWGGDKSIGLATSINEGASWTKEATNPVIEHADIGAWCTAEIDPWGIIKVGTTYYLWVNDVSEVPRQSGLMTSTDLITWTPDANNPIFDNGRYCVTPIKYNSNYYLFVPYTPFGDVFGADPWSYRIELYRDTDPRFLSGSRKFLGAILLGGANGEWDDDYLDTPSILTTTIQRDTFPMDDIYMYYCASSYGTLFTQGLAMGKFEILENLTAIAEPSAGE